MAGVLISLWRFGLRLVVGVVVALLLALGLALIRGDASFASSLRIMLIFVGGFSLLLAGGGSSPSLRRDPDPYLAHFLPTLSHHWQYQRPALSDSAIFVLVGLLLIAVGFVMPV